MKKLLFFLVVSLVAILTLPAQNPYAAFGMEEQVLHYDDTHKEDFNNDSLKPIGYAIYSPQLGLVGIFDLSDSLVAVQKIDPSKVARWLSIDPLANQYPSWSPYNYTLGNPIKFIDPDGRSVESTHTDADGNVIAVYDDGDLGVYRHGNISPGTHPDGAKAYVDQLRSYLGTSGGGEHMGNSLHAFSFTDFGALQKGSVVPKGKIDFSSHWALEAVKGVMWNMMGKTIVHYALNAGQGQKYDIKSKAFKEQGGIYYGSILYNDGSTNIYASARDAGNFAAGEVQQKSAIPNYVTSVGFGSFNYAQSKPLGALYSLEKFVLDANPDPFSFGPTSPLKSPYYGEDIGTGNGIKAGREYYKAHPYLYNLRY